MERDVGDMVIKALKQEYIYYAYVDEHSSFVHETKINGAYMDGGVLKMGNFADQKTSLVKGFIINAEYAFTEGGYFLTKEEANQYIIDRLDEKAKEYEARKTDKGD